MLVDHCLGPDTSCFVSCHAHPSTRNPSHKKHTKSRHPGTPVSKQAPLRPCAGARLLVSCFAHKGSSSSSNGGGSDFSEQLKTEAKKRAMLQYVRQVDPESAHQFMEQTNPAVIAAMKQTVTNIVGSLPPQYFEVKISTVAESLAQLMLSLMTTGYMFRSAQYRLELQNSLGGAAPASSAVAAPAVAEAVVSATASSTTTTATCTAVATSVAQVALDHADYAPGVQTTKVEGDVFRWHLEKGLERLPAREYIEMLEAEVAQLRQQVKHGQAGSAPAALVAAAGGGPGAAAKAGGVGHAAAGVAELEASMALSPAGGFSAGQGLGMVMGPPVAGRNDLLDYLKTLQAHGFKELAPSPSSAAVSEAMNHFISRLMGTSDGEALRSMTSEFSASDLSKVLFWLMAVGYTLRSMEDRMDIEDSLDLPRDGKGPGLLPGW